MVDEAYDKRWIDFARNVGKETGGFCSSPYGCNSYILLSWNNRMADVFTIAHELGHAGHFRLCNGAQSLFDTNVSGYLIEAPSTMNELLLAQDLLRKNTDKRFRRWVLSSLIGHTYHNFVTHLREAWYQRAGNEHHRAGRRGERRNALRHFPQESRNVLGRCRGADRGLRAHLDAPAALLYGTLLLHLQRRSHARNTGRAQHCRRGREAPWRAGARCSKARQHARSARSRRHCGHRPSTPDALEHTIAWPSPVSSTRSPR